MTLTFESDCARCYGLCCVALSFQRSSQFGHDKNAGDPCLYLETDFRCRIHERREDLGYDGCEAFDCLGAGQRASALFPDGDWRKAPERARELYASFSVLTRLQEMRQALTTAADLDLSLVLHTERQSLLNRVGALADGSLSGLGQAAGDSLADAKAFLRRLAPALAG